MFTALVVLVIILAILALRGPILFVAVSFLMHPIQFVRDARRSRRMFDRDGHPHQDTSAAGGGVMDDRANVEPADPTTRFVYRLYIDAPTAEEANRYLAERIGITGWRRIGMRDRDEYVAAMRRAAATRSNPDGVSDSEKLRYVADLFDATDIATGAPGQEVQDDLRRIASRLDELVELDEAPEIAELLAAINNSLTNGSQMTRGNLAFEYLCIRLGIARGQHAADD